MSLYWSLFVLESRVFYILGGCGAVLNSQFENNALPWVNFEWCRKWQCYNIFKLFHFTETFREMLE